MDDFMVQQLDEEKAKLDEAKKLCGDLERDIVGAKERLQLEREQHEGLLDRFEAISRDISITMKEQNVKVKKLRDQYKKDSKVADKKRTGTKKKK